MFNPVLTIFAKLAISGGSCAKKCKKQLLVPIFFLEFNALTLSAEEMEGNICAILHWEQRKIKYWAL